MILVLVLFIALWTAPFILRKKPSKKVLLRMAIGFVVCAAIGLAISSILEIGVAYALYKLVPSYNKFLTEPILAGVIEEGIKCLIALVCVHKLEDADFIDIVLIFGMTGAGFEFAEGILYGGGAIGALLRTILAMHIFWLYFEGMGYAKKKLEGKKVFLRNLLISMFLHFLFDLGIFMLEKYSGNPDMEAVAFLAELGALILNASLVVYCIKKIRKAMPPKKPKAEAGKSEE